MQRPRVAVYSGTRNLYRAMLPAVKSLLTNSSVDLVWLLTEDYEEFFPFRLPDRVRVRNVSGQQYFRRDGPNYNNRWTYMTMMKVTLAQEFPDLDRALMLDVDTFVVRNIDELWDMDLTGYWLAAVHDMGRGNDQHYFNGGVMYFNLAEMRRDGADQRIIDAINTRHYTFVEQEAISEICRGRILRLGGEWNASSWTDHSDNPRIVHYAAVRDWSHQPLAEEWRKRPWPPERA